MPEESYRDTGALAEWSRVDQVERDWGQEGLLELVGVIDTYVLQGVTGVASNRAGLQWTFLPYNVEGV